MNSIKIYNKTIVVLLAMSGLVFLIGVTFHHGLVTRIARSGIIVFTFLLYLLYKKSGDLFFGLFLLCTLVLESLFYFNYYFKFLIEESIYSTVCLISYIGLFNHLALGTKIKVIIKRYFYHLLMALLVGVFAFLKLNDFLSYHYYNGFASSILHLSYNIFVVLSLLFSFFNYLTKKDNNAIMLFVASICIVFLEFLTLASYYIKGSELLRLFRASFFLIGFYFLCRYIVKSKITVHIK